MEANFCSTTSLEYLQKKEDEKQALAEKKQARKDMLAMKKQQKLEAENEKKQKRKMGGLQVKIAKKKACKRAEGGSNEVTADVSVPNLQLYKEDDDDQDDEDEDDEDEENDEEVPETDRCPVCQKTNQHPRKWVGCDECEQWYHRRCLDEVVRGHKHWKCPKCHEQEA